MKISYTKGRTINTGNFNSTRIDIGIDIIYADGEEDTAFEKAKEWVNKRLALEKGD